MSVETTAGLITAISLLLLVGATGKSAQVPLYVWLPDAMAGPTPVSALIHAATMVTAGIYMITRSHALFALAPVAQDTVAWIGAITALLAATIAVGQFDIKRVLAFSTISQLGFMVAAVGLGGYVAGMFHLITHAFFKALLFLSSGSVIHAMEHGMHAVHAHGGGGHDHDDHSDRDTHADHGHDDHPHFDPQDMRNMGGLWRKVPVTKWVYLIGALALAGIFPLAGFWSKDEVLLDAFKHNQTIYWMLALAAFFTAFYMGRQVLMVFFGKPRTPEAAHAGESPAVMLIPLVLLAILSVFGGMLNLPTIAGWAPPNAHALTEWLGHTVAAPGEAHGDSHTTTTDAHPTTTSEHGEAEAPEGELNFLVAGLSTLMALTAIAVSYVVYGRAMQSIKDEDPLREVFGPLFDFLTQKWKMDELYQALILDRYDDLARFTAEAVDWRFWHDWFHDSFIAGVYRAGARLLAEGGDLGFIDTLANGLADFSRSVGGAFRAMQSGYVRTYALMVFIGVVVVLGYMLIAVLPH
jgi:NADH-quinone oxidoreductase subunit L